MQSTQEKKMGYETGKEEAVQIPVFHIIPFHEILGFFFITDGKVSKSSNMSQQCHFFQTALVADFTN